MCSDTVQLCYNIKPVLIVLKYFIVFLQWSVPGILLVLGTLDMFKAVYKANDQKVVDEARKKFIKRLIYGVIIFLVPFFISLVLSLFEESINVDNDSWLKCWQNVDKKDTDYFIGCEDIYEYDEEDNGGNGNDYQINSRCIYYDDNNELNILENITEEECRIHNGNYQSLN